MTCDICYLRYRDVVLAVCRSQPGVCPDGSLTVSMAPLLQEPVSQVEIPGFLGDMVQFYKCELYLLMTGDPVPFVRSEDAVDVICKSYGYIQEAPLTCCLREYAIPSIAL